MAKSAIFAADHPGGTTHQDVETPVSAMCNLGRCNHCKGEVLSLLVPVGTRCGHDCHRKEVAA